MLGKKNYLLNCEICDTRRMKEEDYAEFEKLTINAEFLIVSERSKGILNRLPLTLNQENVLELPEDLEVSVQSINGPYEISGTSSLTDPVLLTVNGPLTIQPDTENILKNYVAITVNGPVECPKSMEGCLGKISVNGPVTIYPDDCVLLAKKFVLDRYFPLRAKQGTGYFAERQVTIPDAETDLSKLVQKNVRFLTKRLVVPESLVEDCAEIFDESAEFIVVPEGMALILKNVEINETLVQKCGKRLFVDGSVTFPENFAFEEMLDELIVTGTVALRESQKEAFERIHASCERLETLWEGRLIENKVSVKIDQNLLENSPEGVRVKNAVKVILAGDVTPQMILERLEIVNCADVCCSAEQESAAAAISVNVARIGKEEEKKTEGILEGFGELLNTKLINAEVYRM